MRSYSVTAGYHCGVQVHLHNYPLWLLASWAIGNRLGWWLTRPFGRAGHRLFWRWLWWHLNEQVNRTVDIAPIEGREAFELGMRAGDLAEAAREHSVTLEQLAEHWSDRGYWDECDWAEFGQLSRDEADLKTLKKGRTIAELGM